MSERALAEFTHKRFGAQMNENVVLNVAHLVGEIVTSVADEFILVHIGPKHGRTRSAMFDQTRDSRVRHDNAAVLTKVGVEFERHWVGQESFHVQGQIVEQRKHGHWKKKWSNEVV